MIAGADSSRRSQGAIYELEEWKFDSFWEEEEASLISQKDSGLV